MKWTGAPGHLREAGGAVDAGAPERSGAEAGASMVFPTERATPKWPGLTRDWTGQRKKLTRAHHAGALAGSARKRGPHTMLCRPPGPSNCEAPEPPRRPKSMKMPSESESADSRMWSTRFSGLEDGGEPWARPGPGLGGCVGGYSLLGQGPDWGPGEGPKSPVGPWPGPSGQDVISETECRRTPVAPVAEPSASCSATGFSSGVL